MYVFACVCVFVCVCVCVCVCVWGGGVNTYMYMYTQTHTRVSAQAHARSLAYTDTKNVIDKSIKSSVSSVQSWWVTLNLGTTDVNKGTSMSKTYQPKVHCLFHARFER